MQYASWGSVSFVSVESACRHYGVSMTSPMTSLTSLGVMFRNLEESRSRSLHVRQKYPRSSLRFNPGYAPTGAWTHPVLSRLLAAVWPYEFVQMFVSLTRRTCGPLQWSTPVKPSAPSRQLRSRRTLEPSLAVNKCFVRIRRRLSSSTCTRSALVATPSFRNRSVTTR